MNQSKENQPKSSYLSMLAGPWLIFVSTAIVLFLKNQKDLSDDVSMLLPYLVSALLLALFFWACVKALYFFKLNGLANFIAWCILLIVPFFWVYQAGINTAFQMRYQTIWLAVIGCTLLLSAFLLYKRAALTFVYRATAMIAVCFMALDALKLFTASSTNEGSSGQRQNVSEAELRQLPDIYHFILDEYQTELFSNTVTPELEEKLAGFTIYPNNTSVFGRTEMSLPTIFLSQNYDFKSTPAEFQEAAFAEDRSFLHTLREAGYSTSGYMHPIFDFKVDQFDTLLFHKAIVTTDPSEDQKSLFKLWMFSVLPTRLSGMLLTESDADQLKFKTLLSTSAPNISFKSSEIVMENEKNLPGYGRYQMLHVLIPHFPHTLSPNCEFGKEFKTNPKTHTQCGNKVLVDYLELLKDLGRFENSLIIMHSDHGSGFAFDNGKLRKLSENEDFRYGLEYARARSRAILMIKPLGVGDGTKLQYSQAQSSVLDIAPTLLNQVNLPVSDEMEGYNLIDGPAISNDREKEYYFYNKRGTQGRHIIKMTKYSIKNDTYVKEGLVDSGIFEE